LDPIEWTDFRDQTGASASFCRDLLSVFIYLLPSGEGFNLILYGDGDNSVRLQRRFNSVPEAKQFGELLATNLSSGFEALLEVLENAS
jgi:hypothetical protein